MLVVSFLRTPKLEILAASSGPSGLKFEPLVESLQAMMPMLGHEGEEKEIENSYRSPIQNF